MSLSFAYLAFAIFPTEDLIIPLPFPALSSMLGLFDSGTRLSYSLETFSVTQIQRILYFLELSQQLRPRELTLGTH